MNPRVTLLAGGLFGATGVIGGAFGAHALRAFLIARGMAEVWETAVHFQLVHAVALVGLAAWSRGELAPVAARRCARAALCWSAGLVFFSGSLYLLAAGAPRWVGPVTPLGGLALIAGWLFLASVPFAAKKG